jgi:hypothetical protein
LSTVPMARSVLGIHSLPQKEASPDKGRTNG